MSIFGHHKTHDFMFEQAQGTNDQLVASGCKICRDRFYEAFLCLPKEVLKFLKVENVFSWMYLRIVGLALGRVF